MPTNNFLPFTPTDTGTNLLTQAEYAAAADRTVGNQPGVASSKLNNRAIRQANVISSQLAQFICNKTGLNMLDDGDLSTLLSNMVTAFAPTTQQYDITNLILSTSVSASALTVAVKTKAGTDASATSPITVGMRSATLTSGLYSTRSITGALSMVVSSGSTLGQVDAQPSFIYVYLIDNAGTLELAVSHQYYLEDAVVTTTAEGGSGGADSASAIYSTTSRSNVPIRLIGYILNTQTTAGTWASAGTQIQLLPDQAVKLPTIQKFTSSSGTYITPAGCKYIRVQMVGGGGGGATSGSATSTAATNGGATSLGTSLLSAAGGGGTSFGAPPAAGGSASLGSGPIGLALTGGSGGIGNIFQQDVGSPGGVGGASAFGGAGGAGGGAGVTNTGGGGGGGNSTNGTIYSGSGGGSGGYVEAIINNPLASYPYVVGAAGTGGAVGAGTGAVAGGAGGSGVIVVTEYYQ